MSENLSKEVKYRMSILIGQGMSSADALDKARAEYHAVAVVRNEHFKREAIRKNREKDGPKITPRYGRQSMVGREDASKYKAAAENPLWNPKERRFAR